MGWRIPYFMQNFEQQDLPNIPLKENPNIRFAFFNNVIGWAVFAISTLIYTFTVERTASFWDCGEFIACAYKLQVPHPPGAPFFLLLGRMFSILATDVTHVAFWVNMMSVFASGFTILFLFWTIVMFGVKLFPDNKDVNSVTATQAITLWIGGAVGALAYAFSDSFWFSAVEAEVYALSSFFTAFVVWALLKWERITDEADANRWLVLTAYMIGLSIGVHLLNLVTLPALALIYYYKKVKTPTPVGVLSALAIGGALVILILEGVITGLPSLAGNVEIFMVNNLGVPFGTGILLFVFLVIGSIIYGFSYTYKTKNVLLNTALLSATFILIGYASYGIALVRANYNPPINENDPSDIIKFVSYLKREQYGDRPLTWGPSFASEVARDESGAPKTITKGQLYRMRKDKGTYEIYDERKSYIYDDNMFLPRLHSRDPQHRTLYAQRLGLGNEMPKEYKPTQSDNMKFLFSYQFGYMYWRYFGWNFIGREHDFEGANTLFLGKNITNAPKEYKNNKARNQYYALPLILGIIGLAFCGIRSPQTLFVSGLLFFLTGLALVLYLNSPPTEPRERDYIYVGSFYAFAIWIGFGAMAFPQILAQYLKNDKLQNVGNIAGGIFGALVVGIMLQQNYDDHNRDNRWHSIDSAKNLLESCAPNAILFTGGDNDTFPLWYLQEVENFRTDVRVCNLSLLGTDWYISQMKRPAYKSDALPISLNYEAYITGKNEQILYPIEWGVMTNIPENQLKNLNEKGMDLKTYIDLVNKGDKFVEGSIRGSEEKFTILPSKKLVYRFNRDNVKKLGIVPAEKDSLLGNYIAWELKKSEISKPDLIILDMIAHNDWKRPIYFSTTLGGSNNLDLKEYMQTEGLANRLMPYKVKNARDGVVNSDLMYNNLLTKFHYRSLDNPKVYHDENYLRLTINLRMSFVRLLTQLLREGKTEKAQKALDFVMKKMPYNVIEHDYTSPLFADIMYKLGDTKKADAFCEEIIKISLQQANFYIVENPGSDRLQYALSALDELRNVYKINGNEKKSEDLERTLQGFLAKMNP